MHKWVPSVQRVRNVPLTGKPSVSTGWRLNFPLLDAGIFACHQKPSFPLSHLQVGTLSLFVHDPDAQSHWENGSRLGTRTASWTSLKALVQRDTRDLQAFFRMADTVGARGWGCPRVRSAALGIRRMRSWPGRTHKARDLSLGWDWSRPSRQSRE